MKKENKKETSLVLPVTAEFVERRIHIVRGQKVLLDSDLAGLYQVLTKNLNKAVKRNNQRFPSDFMFQLTREEVESRRFQIGTAPHNNMRSQFATLKKGVQNLKFQTGTSSWGGSRKLPYAFTELGVAMLSSVLNSDRAVQMNIYIMRAFVKLREIMADNVEINKKIKELEKGHVENKEHIIAVASTLKRMMSQKKSAIGFVVDTR